MIHGNFITLLDVVLVQPLVHEYLSKVVNAILREATL